MLQSIEKCLNAARPLKRNVITTPKREGKPAQHSGSSNRLPDLLPFDVITQVQHMLTITRYGVSVGFFCRFVIANRYYGIPVVVETVETNTNPCNFGFDSLKIGSFECHCVARFFDTMRVRFGSAFCSVVLLKFSFLKGWVSLDLFHVNPGSRLLS